MEWSSRCTSTEPSEVSRSRSASVSIASWALARLRWIIVPSSPDQVAGDDREQAQQARRTEQFRDAKDAQLRLHGFDRGEPEPQQAEFDEVRGRAKHERTRGTLPRDAP